MAMADFALRSVTFRSAYRPIGWQPQADAGPFRRSPFERELAPVQEDDLPRERQPQSEPAWASGVERADVARVVAREPRAVVLHVQGHRVRAALGPQLHVPSPRG